MSEVVESIKCLIQKASTERGNAADGVEFDEKSFLSTNTRFIGSPAPSNSFADEAAN